MKNKTSNISLCQQNKMIMAHTITTFRNYDGTRNVRYAAKITGLDVSSTVRGIDYYSTGNEIYVVGFAHKFFATEQSAINAANRVFNKLSNSF